MKNPFLRHLTLREIILGVLILGPLLGLGQKASNTQIFPRQKFNHLLKSPSTLTCDSLGTFRATFTYYTNAMPGADNAQIIWSCWIGQGDLIVLPNGATPPMCSKLLEKKVYLFFEKEVYVYGALDKNRKKIYSPPLFVVIEYYDSSTKKVRYIKTSDFLNRGSVD